MMVGKFALTLFAVCVLAVCCRCEENEIFRFDTPRSSEQEVRCTRRLPTFQDCVTCGDKPKSVRLHVLNVAKKPYLNNTISIHCTYQEYLLGMMQEAANEDKSFRFTSTYFNHELGFYVDAYDAVSAHCNEDGLYWAILDGNMKPTPLGVSNYKPVDWETVTFNITSC